MRKSKIMKALLVFGMSVVTATAMVGFAACDKPDSSDGGDTTNNTTNDNNNQGGNNTEHEHNWTWTYVDDTTHSRTCTADGHTGNKTETASHGTLDADNKCPDCKHQFTLGGDTTTKETVAVGIKGIYDASTATPTTKNEKTIANETVLASGLKVYGTPLADPNSKSITYNGDTISLSHRLKLSSKATNGSTPMGIEVNLDADATVIVYYYSGSSNNVRGLELYDGTEELTSKSTAIADTTQEHSDGNVMATAMFSVEANHKYYIGASVAGVNVYYIAVVYGNVGETWTDHAAKTATCGVAGNIAYSVSNYGRYKKADGTYIRSNEYTLAALNHSYTLKAGSLVIPTNDPEHNDGAVTLTCANGHDDIVPLPVLSSNKYTARPAVGQTGTYTITINGVAISFEATGIAEQETTYTDVYKLDRAAIDKLDNSVTTKTADQNCVYRKCYTSGSNSFSGSMDPTNDKGLYVGDSSSRTDVRIALGTPISTGVVKISGTIEAGGNNSKWRFFQLHGSAEPDKETLCFGTSGNKKLQCYAAAVADGYVGTEASEQYSAGTAINFEIIIDFTTKKATVKLNNTVYLEEQAYDANDLSEIGLNVNDGRSVILHNITIATQD